MLLSLWSILLSGNRKKRRKELDSNTEALPAKHRRRRHAVLTAHHGTGTDGEPVPDYFWAPKSLQMVIAAMELKDACSLEGKLWPN